MSKTLGRFIVGAIKEQQDKTMQMLKIIKCSDPMRWYASKIGELVPFLGDSRGEYKSREDSGYVNFVQYSDAEVVVVEETTKEQTNE